MLKTSPPTLCFGGLRFVTKSKISTNREQVRSIDDQLAVLRSVAKNEGLNVAEEFIEKQSAKKPGRPVFNKMLAKIEKGEARGVAEIQWASVKEAH